MLGLGILLEGFQLGVNVVEDPNFGCHSQQVLRKADRFDVGTLEVSQVSKGLPVECGHRGLGDPVEDLEDAWGF